jgi:hypothetical protein
LQYSFWTLFLTPPALFAPDVALDPAVSLAPDVPFDPVSPADVLSVLVTGLLVLSATGTTVMVLVLMMLIVVLMAWEMGAESRI